MMAAMEHDADFIEWFFEERSMCETLEEVIENLRNKSTGQYIHGSPWSNEDLEKLFSETGRRTPRQLEQTLKTHGALDTWQEQYFLSYWPDGTTKITRTFIRKFSPALKQSMRP